MPKVAVSEIEAVAKAALQAYGAEDPAAQAVAHATAHAEAHGNIICGLYYLESYCIQLASGRVSGTVDPVVTHPRAGAVSVDAGGGFAQPAFAKGLDTAIAAAKANGIAMLAVHNAHTCTSLGYFTEQIAQAGLIGIGHTNASPIVAPPGGNKPVIGTNPMALSVPDGAGGMALHFDCSTSAVALGKITMAKEAGEEIPLGWAVDSSGAPTTDPVAALGGALQSMGGYKGWGIGLMVELLAAGMTGGVNSLDVKGIKLADGPPHRLGQFYILMDTTTYGDHFIDRLNRIEEAVAAQDGGRIPGANRSAMTEIDVPDALWAKCKGLGTQA